MTETNEKVLQEWDTIERDAKRKKNEVMIAHYGECPLNKGHFDQASFCFGMFVATITIILSFASYTAVFK